MLGFEEDEGESRFPSSGRAATAVGVVFDLVWKLMVENKGEVRDIDSTSSDIGGDEELDSLFFKGAHHLVAFLLSEITLEDFD